MIPIRLLNGSTLYVNSDLVESVAAAPDTIITLTSGRTIVARSSPQEIIDAVVAYRRRVLEAPVPGASPPGRAVVGAQSAETSAVV
ncbi:MAG: flagellar FlbD family protein [Planctomycetota bacterium]